MLHSLIAPLIWVALAASFIMTVGGISARLAWPLFVAAALSFACGVALVFSIGIYVVALAGLQLLGAFVFRRQQA